MVKYKNKGIRNRCWLSLISFNIDINKVVKEWKNIMGRLQLSSGHTLRTGIDFQMRR
jgi:hypothetical protein